MTTASDYYPFGWSMPNRKLNAGNYSFGFNGQIQDTEWMGGQSVAFEFRTQDARLGRFLSTDPLTAMTPWETPYAFAGNNPVLLIDLLGLGVDNPTGSPPAKKKGGGGIQFTPTDGGAINAAVAAMNASRPKPTTSSDMMGVIQNARDNSFDHGQQLNLTNNPRNGINVYDFSAQEEKDINYIIDDSKRNSNIISNNLEYLDNRCDGPGQYNMIIHNIDIRKSCDARSGVSSIQTNGTAGGADNVFYPIYDKNKKVRGGSLSLYWQISLDGTSGITNSTINEEILHIGQKKFYYVDNKININHLTIETEAKILKILAYSNQSGVNRSGNTSQDVYANFRSAGFSNYELNFLFNINNKGVSWATKDGSSMKTVLQNPNSIYTDTKVKELFNQQAGVLGKAVDNIYSKKAGWDKTQTIQPFDYMDKLLE